MIVTMNGMCVGNCSCSSMGTAASPSRSLIFRSPILLKAVIEVAPTRFRMP
jgi:hypothetical protein